MNQKFENLQELLRERRSIRSFSKVPVDPKIIEAIFDSVRFSPTPTNRLCYRFMALSDPLVIDSIRQEVLSASGKIAEKLDEERAKSFLEYAQWFSFFNKAPIVIFGFFRLFSSRFPAPNMNNDSLEGVAELQAFGGAMHALLLGLEAQGLSACWMSGPLIAEEQILSKLKIEKPWRLGSLLPIGYSDTKPAIPKKPELSTVFQWWS
ncbi:MAG: nitroreductase family protein [Candidatus Riflebacteria bacterium]|nr:nitroreductase family protein [Candidatus Riflebacteria bacterium]